MINLRFATQDHKDHVDYRVTDDLITDGMSQRTWWEIVLGVKCQVAYRMGIGGKDIWTVWLRDADWSYAMQRWRNSCYRDTEDVRFLVADFVYSLDDFPELEHILGFRLAYDPNGTDLAIDEYKVYTREPISPPGRPIFDSDNWKLTHTLIGDKAWRDVDIVGIMFGPEEGPRECTDTRVRFYINGIYKETDYHIWVYTSEDSFTPRGYTRKEVLK